MNEKFGGKRWLYCVLLEALRRKSSLLQQYSSTLCGAWRFSLLGCVL
jgi:hypothetical protein